MAAVSCCCKCGSYQSVRIFARLLMWMRHPNQAEERLTARVHRLKEDRHDNNWPVLPAVKSIVWTRAVTHTQGSLLAWITDQHVDTELPKDASKKACGTSSVWRMRESNSCIWTFHKFNNSCSPLRYFAVVFDTRLTFFGYWKLTMCANTNALWNGGSWAW